MLLSSISALLILRHVELIKSVLKNGIFECKNVSLRPACHRMNIVTRLIVRFRVWFLRNVSIKYFDFCGCEVVATSKQRSGLWSFVFISCWWLVCVTKIAARVVIAVGIVDDVQIITTTKGCSIRRITVDRVFIFSANDWAFKWLQVVWVP